VTRYAPDDRRSTPPVGDLSMPSSEGEEPDQPARIYDLETRYRTLVEELPAVVYMDGVGDHDRMIDIGPSIKDLLGISREEWLGSFLPWDDALHPDDHDRVMAESERCVATGEPFRMEYRMIHRDGRSVWIREDATLIRDENGGPMYWLGFLLDITDRKEAAQQLEDTRARYGALVEQIPAIVYIDVVDEDMTTTYVSPQIESILGVTPQEYCDDPDLWADHLHPDDRDQAMDTYLAGRQAGGSFTFEYRLLARDGRVVWFRDSAVVIHDHEGRPQYVHGVMLDITERKIAEEQVAFLAYHDKLTGLPNRALFEELLDVALARGRRHDLGVAVVSVDVDNFKLVNDSLGHDAGDDLLRQLAERLGEATRETDLVARPGGDEFLLLLADLDRTSPVPGGSDGGLLVAQSVAVRVQQALR
jgi:PAS domain S-box-containing protein